MKTIRILIAAVLTSVTATASTVIFTDVHNQSFTVQIEGKTYNSRHGEVSVPYVTPGRHSVQIITYTHSRGRAPIETITRSTIHIPAHSVVYAQVHRNNSVSVARVEQVRTSTRVAQSRPAPQPTVRTTSRPVVSCADMSDVEFQRLSRQLAIARFDSERFDIAMHAIRFNHLTSYQVYMIASAFSFEQYRIQIAENAYLKTVDPYNYDIVYDALTFSSSRRQLSQYIAGTHSPYHYYDSGTYYSYRTR